MRLIKIMMVASIALVFTAAGCKKEKYTSRDTSMLKPNPVVEEPVDPTLVTYNNVDAADGWETVGSPVISAGGKQGAGYLKNTITNGNDFMQFINNTTPAVDTKLTEATGQFKFWWYISNVSLLKQDGSIEITSSGKSDDHESAWDVAPLIPLLQNGWNEIKLNFSDAIKSADGGANYAAINHFRIFFFTTSKDHSDLITGVDDLRFSAKAD